MEIEVKIRAADLAAVAKLAEGLGMALEKPRHFERNTLYDHPDRSLSVTGCMLRVRWEEGGGQFTFKGKVISHDRYKVRPEVETACKDPGALEDILRNIGMQPFFRYEKFRTQYGGEGVHLCLDELPFGEFLEIEGEGEAIEALAAKLGLEGSDFMKRSYADLYGEHCREQGLQFGDIVFPEKR